MSHYRVGLVGSHRTGKTTLAKLITTHPYIDAEVGKVFKKNQLSGR